MNHNEILRLLDNIQKDDTPKKGTFNKHDNSTE